MGLSEQKVSLNGRRIMIASYVEEVATQPKTSLRNSFPATDTDYMGGRSDGQVYMSNFAGKDLTATFEMVRSFLNEEGYKDIPIPADVEELLKFQLATRNRQVLLFEDNGYVHNPVKILFPLDRRKKSTLILKIYNEAAEQHLLRFHNKLEEKNEYE
jgi:hypothetical protein